MVLSPPSFLDHGEDSVTMYGLFPCLIAAMIVQSLCFSSVGYFGSEDHAMEGDIDQELISDAETAWAQREWSIQHVLFPSMRLFFKPPTSMATNGTFVQVL